MLRLMLATLHVLFIVGSVFSADAEIVLPKQPVPTPLPAASIEVVDSRGQPINGEVGLSQQIVVTSTKAVRGEDQDSLVWIIEPEDKLQIYSTPDGATKVITTPATDATLSIMQIVALGDRIAYQRLTIKCGKGPQPPPGPIPPGPLPPTPDPLPTIGVRILAITDATANMTKDQVNALNSPKVTALLNEKTKKDFAQRPSWRRWDKDTDISREPEWKTFFDAAMKEYTERKENPETKINLPMLCVEKGNKLTIFEINTESGLLSTLNSTFGQ